jgi:hypothetical protein
MIDFLLLISLAFFFILTVWFVKGIAKLKD